MIYEWEIKATVNGTEVCDLILAETDPKAREQFEYAMMDYSTGPTRYKSVTKTGRVLVHESQIRVVKK